MIDLEVLAQYGTTNAALRSLFVVEAMTPEEARKATREEREANEKKLKFKEQLEKQIEGVLNEAILYSVRNYTYYGVMDITWDTSAISKQTLPLLLYAQGKLDMSSCTSALRTLPNADVYLKKGADGAVTGIDLPKFLTVEYNLVRSFITRRVSAQSNKYSNLWPYYKYESRSTGMVGKIRSDALSQRVDIMADQFDYRHHDVQCMRGMMMYTQVVDFIRSAWETDKQICQRPAPEGFEPAPGAPLDLEEQIVREGVCFVNPHPSRTFYDKAHPLSSLNHDNGCEFVGYWDVCRYKDIVNNPLYWRREKVSYSPPSAAIFTDYRQYFTQYFDYSTLTPPTAVNSSMDLPGQNDMKNQLGIYSADMENSAVFRSEFFRKLRPVDYGIGTYPYPVWIRFVVAGDNTVIYAELCPSRPAAVLSFNAADGRMVNLSFGHSLMSYQDQMNNLLNQMLLLCQQECVKIFQINTDFIKEKKHLDWLRAKLSGQNFASGALVVEVSLSELSDAGIDPRAYKAIEVTETKVGQSMATILSGMAQLITLVEKLEAMSPAEQGQPAPREISATEVNEISSTTSSVYTFISDSIDEFIAAKKEIIYESILACAKSQVRLPVLNRYSEKSIKQAGFEVVPEENEDYPGDYKRRTIIGSHRKLQHSYIFTTRDGAERPVNTQAANTLVQLLAQVINIPSILQAMGKEKLYNVINEIFRLSGAGIDMNLELREGEDDSLGADPLEELKSQVDQLVPLIQQLAEQVKGNAQALSEQQQVNADQEQAIALQSQLAGEVKKIGQKVEQIVSGPMIKIIESLDYKDAPPDIQRQIEGIAGLQPSSAVPTDPAVLNGHIALGEARQDATHAEDAHLTEQAIAKTKGRLAIESAQKKSAQDEEAHRTAQTIVKSKAEKEEERKQEKHLADLQHAEALTKAKVKQTKVKAKAEA